MPSAYYDTSAEAFFRDTVDADMGDARRRFLRLLPPAAHILDAGCGSGRDALAFSREGFTVTAFDQSREMVRMAAAHSGLPVVHLSFDDVEWEAAFDGVWASASLLHVPRFDLPSAAGHLVRALKPGGLMFTSFKFGITEREKDGRHFTDMTDLSLGDLMHEVGVEVIELWPSSDTRPGREHELWASAICRKPMVAKSS